MSSRQDKTAAANPIAKRCLEILDQMTRQLVSCQKHRSLDQEHMRRLRADLAKLVHWALQNQGNPDVVARIHDCYRRCDLDIDDTTVLRLVRGAVKGELRKAGIDTSTPGLDPALDPPTIILTTRRTIQRLGGAASSSTAPGPALDRKQAPPSEAKPPTTRSRRQAPAAKPKAVTPAEMRTAFDRIVEATLAKIQSGGHGVERADYLALVYNDDAKKAKFLAQIAAELPPTEAKSLSTTVDGFFRDSFKGSYIERMDRTGHRRAQKR